MTLPDTSRLHSQSSVLTALTRSARDEQGQSLVETALTMLILIGLLFAVIEGCVAVYSYHYLANAAHEAARYAIVRGGDWSTTCDAAGGWSASMCMASPDNVAHYVANRGFPGINIVPDNVYVSYFHTIQANVSTGCPGTNGPTTYNRTGDVVQVTICYPFTFALPFGTYTYNLASTSQMTIAQ